MPIISSVAALGTLLLARGDNGWAGDEPLRLATMKPQTSLDYLVLGSVYADMDPAKAMANLDRGVELGAGAMSRLLRARAMIWVALTTGALTDIRKAAADAEFANSLLFQTNLVAVATRLSASLVEAKLLEGKNEAGRQEVLLRAKADAVMLQGYTNSQPVIEARLDYYDYTGNEEAFAREAELEWRSFGSGGTLGQYTVLLFGQADSGQAWAVAKEAAARQPSLMSYLRSWIVADATGDVQEAIRFHRSYPAPDGFRRLNWAGGLLVLGQTQQAQEQIRQLKGQFSFFFQFRNGWYEHLFNYYIGELDADCLVQRAGSSLLNACEGHYAIGLMNLSLGHKAEAKRHFAAAVQSRVYSYFEYASARALLKRMETDPGWPPWIQEGDEKQAAAKSAKAL